MAWRRYLAAVAVLTVVAGDPVTGAAQDDPNDDHQRVLSNSLALILTPRAEASEALQALVDRGDPDVAAALVMALRYSPLPQSEVSAALRELTGDQEADDWFTWMLWQQANPQITPHASYEQYKTDILTRIDPGFRRFVRPGRDRGIRLEEIVWGGVRVDGIPALINPTLIEADEADYLEPDDLVFGVEINGDARAYPLRIMDWHEMFNDVIGGVPVALAYCTLCGSGILFETTVDGYDEPFTFGSSGMLYRSNKLMYDHQTDSLWNQFTGRPVTGVLYGTDIELAIRSVAITSWENWRDRNPDTQVLSLDTGFHRDYAPGAAYAAYFESAELMFPALVEDPTLAQKDYVFGIRTVGGSRAWPVTAFEGGRVINDRVGALEVVLIGDASTRTVRAYRRDGREFRDVDTGRVLADDQQSWQVTEEALVGEDGTQLARVGGHVAFWFAWAGYLGGETSLYE